MSLLKIILNTLPRPVLIKASYWVRPFLSFWYRGSKFTDPIDGNSFRKFLSYGYEKPRKNALSPSTLSLERHRLLWLYLQNKTNFFSSPQKVLHIAPEQCFLKRFKNSFNLDYTTADLHSPIADVKADVCNLPFKNNTFDVVFCNHVLEHVKEDTKAMQELYRVLKVGGFGIFQVPQDVNRKITFEDNSITNPKERAKVFGQYDHLRIYGLDYFNKLRSVGFTVQEITYAKEIGAELTQKYALTPNEILPVCFKL